MSLTRSSTQRDQDYAALFHCIGLIDKIIAGNMEDDTSTEQIDSMTRNVKHLEKKLALSDWEDDRNLSQIQPAINRGRQYLNSV